MYWIWLLIVVSLTLILFVTVPQSVLRTAFGNCTRADGSKSMRRRQRERQQLLALVGGMVIIPIILMLIHISVTILVEQFYVEYVPEEWVAEIERADTVDNDVNEAVAEFSEWHDKQQLHSYTNNGSWQNAIWDNWMYFAADAVLMGIVVYFFLGPFYLLLISNYTQGVERRHRIYSRVDRKRSSKQLEELTEPRNGDSSPGDEKQCISTQEVISPYLDLNDFIRELSRKGFLDAVFNGLELPGKRLSGLGNKEGEYAEIRKGYLSIDKPSVNDNGYPNSLRESAKNGLHKVENELETLRTSDRQKEIENTFKILALEEQLKELKQKIEEVSRFDRGDSPAPGVQEASESTTRVALFCLMDTSSSMDSVKIDIAKRFFILLFFFLQRSYEQIEVIYIQHQATAEELDEDGFFEPQQKSGTVVSSSLQLMLEIILERFTDSKWKLYAAQVSDGDNKEGDSLRCRDILRDRILPTLQYFIYVETAPSKDQTLWREYEILKADYEYLAMQRIDELGSLYTKFRALFNKHLN